MNKKYQIFISSTYEDLKDARRKVQDAILSMYHFPVGMELFSAADDEQWEVIKETIDSTDYYVLILGQRYGSIIEFGKDAGISYTEKEFRYAEENGIPILAFIIDDSALLPKNYIETDPSKIEKLHSFKTTVKNGRLVEWWKTPEELAQKVTTALYKMISRKKRPGWIRSDEFDIEKSHAELLRLNNQIRELEQENQKLKSQVVERKPILNIDFLLDQPMDDEDQNDITDEGSEECSEREYYSHGDLLLKNDESGLKLQFIPICSDSYKYKFEPLTKSDIYPELRGLVSDKAIQTYNEALPNEAVINQYVNSMAEYNRIRKGGVAFIIQIENIGTSKATDVRVSIEFPEEFLIYEVSDLDDIKEPPMPAMPKNPIYEAEKELERRLNPLANLVHQMSMSMPMYSSVRAIGADILSRMNTTSAESIDILGHSVELESVQIQHYNLAWFEHIYIVPTAKGKYQIQCTIMCSEYMEPEVKYIEVEVI